MMADERIDSLVQEHSIKLGDLKNTRLSIYGENNAFFRAIIKAANKTGITVLNGYHAATPLLVDVSSKEKYQLCNENDIDCVISDGMSCVSEATLTLLKTYGLVGRHIVVVGRGHAVKGLAAALLAANATVTVCHSHTRYLMSIMREAEILVVAAPITERFRGLNCNLIVDIAGAFADREESIRQVCDYTKHIGKLTVAILLERVARWHG